MIFNQSEFDIGCEWGENGVLQLAPISDAVVIVDVLSFAGEGCLYPHGRVRSIQSRRLTSPCPNRLAPLQRSCKLAENFLPLTPSVFSILLALAGGEKHGYAVMQAIAQSSAGARRIGPGTLYRSIKQLLASGLIEESDDRPDPALDDERRRYYRLNAFGRRVLKAEAERLARLVSQAQTQGLLRPARPPGARGAR